MVCQLKIVANAGVTQIVIWQDLRYTVDVEARLLTRTDYRVCQIPDKQQVVYHGQIVSTPGLDATSYYSVVIHM